MSALRSNLLVIFVLAIGSLQLFGYLTGLETVRKIGQLTAASPLPLVFSHFRGLETFSPKFYVLVETDATRQEPQVIPITPGNYRLLAGPYNRRNVYGVAFAFGAVLQLEQERALVKSVLCYGFRAEGPVRRIIDETIAARAVTVTAFAPPKPLGIRIVPKNKPSETVELWPECLP